MAVRLIKLAREAKMSVMALIDLLNSLNFHDYEANPNTKIPDNIASIVLACSHGDELGLMNIIAQNSKFEMFTSDAEQLSESDAVEVSNLSNNDLNEKQEAISPELNNPKKSPNIDGTCSNFGIEELFVLTPSNKIESIKISDFSLYQQSPYYSVLIGSNGVGKSSLLSDIVDFFLELYDCSKDPSHVKKIYKGKLIGVRYHVDGQKCFIIRLSQLCLVKINGTFCTVDNLRLPIIVACHFGAFEKFHNQSVNNSGRTKYDVPYYKYVGAHVNGNVISSSSIAFRLLFALTEQMSVKQRQNICSILDFIGYDHLISLQYTLSLKSKKNNVVYDNIKQRVNQDKEYVNMTQQERQEKINLLYNFYKKKIESELIQYIFELNFDKDISSNKSKELQYIYKLKQYNLVSSSKVLFRKKKDIVSSDEMSSGEFTILATILSISAAATEPHTLILLDEPEISQHPNWQMSLIENLDKALNNQSCHLLIATHSHMIVSDLPIKRSSVVQLEKDKNGNISSQLLKASTFGWSAEEVLFKVFKTATDRNRYLGERIANLLEKIGDNTICPENVTKELLELKEVTKHLSDIDPMKSVLKTIIEAYKK